MGYGLKGPLYSGSPSRPPPPIDTPPLPSTPPPPVTFIGRPPSTPTSVSYRYKRLAAHSQCYPMSFNRQQTGSRARQRYDCAHQQARFREQGSRSPKSPPPTLEQTRTYTHNLTRPKPKVANARAPIAAVWEAVNEKPHRTKKTRTTQQRVRCRCAHACTPAPPGPAGRRALPGARRRWPPRAAQSPAPPAAWLLPVPPPRPTRWPGLGRGGVGGCVWLSLGAGRGLPGLDGVPG